MHSCIHSFIYLIFSFKTENHKPIIDSTRVNSASTWVRASTGRLVKIQDTPIPEEITEEFGITVEMSERPNSENQDVETSEPRYTRAEVDVMIGEVLAAKLVELGYTPMTQAQPPVASPASDKGKEPEVFDPLLKEQDASYHKEMLERVRPSKEVIDIPDGSEKGKASIEGELEFLKKEMKRMNVQFQTESDLGFEFEEYVGDESRRGPSDKLHKPSKFDGDGDPI